MHDWKVRRCKREWEFGAVWEFLDACDWEFLSAKVSGEGTRFRVQEVYEREFDVVWELFKVYNWEFPSARASGGCKIESFRGTWLWAQMLSFNAKFSILQLCDFQFHTSKAPGMCAYYVVRGNSLTLNPISAALAVWWNPTLIQAFLSPSPHISIDQVHTLWLLNCIIEA